MNKRQKTFIDKEITLATKIEKINKINFKNVIKINHVTFKLLSIMLISINILNNIKWFFIREKLKTLIQLFIMRTRQTINRTMRIQYFQKIQTSRRTFIMRKRNRTLKKTRFDIENVNFVLNFSSSIINFINIFDENTTINN